MWTPGRFDHLHSSQYTIFLYYLANTIWRGGGERAVCNKLFGLNKALNGIDLFYEIELPEVFFIGHSVGIVLAKATYGNRLVLYQNSTVGKNHGEAPVLGDGVVMYPNTAIIGRCEIGAGTVVEPGHEHRQPEHAGELHGVPGRGRRPGDQAADAGRARRPVPLSRSSGSGRPSRVTVVRRGVRSRYARPTLPSFHGHCG